MSEFVGVRPFPCKQHPDGKDRQNHGKGQIRLIGSHAECQADRTGEEPLPVFSGQKHRRHGEQKPQHISVQSKDIGKGGGKRRERYQQSADEHGRPGMPNLKDLGQKRCRDPKKQDTDKPDHPRERIKGGKPAGDHQKPPAGGNHVLVEIDAVQSVMVGDIGKHHGHVDQKRDHDRCRKRIFTFFPNGSVPFPKKLTRRHFHLTPFKQSDIAPAILCLPVSLGCTPSNVFRNRSSGVSCS